MNFKNFIYIFIFYIICIVNVNAATITINPNLLPIESGNTISQPVNVTISGASNWYINVVTIGDIYNTTGSYIPLSHVNIFGQDGTLISNLLNSYYIPYPMNKVGSNNFNLNFSLTTDDSDRPGIYSKYIAINLYDNGNLADIAFFNLKFNKNEISSVEFSENTTRLSLDKDKILQKGVTQDLNTPLTVYVKSNKDWKLYIRKSTITPNSKITLYIKTMTSDSSIKLDNASGYTKMDTNTYLIASGKATFNDTTRILDKKFITMDYMVKGPDNEFLPVGSESDNIQYILETE